jgi:hypothetical protein
MKKIEKGSKRREEEKREEKGPDEELCRFKLFQSCVETNDRSGQSPVNVKQ